jgi:hypothetical protein
MRINGEMWNKLFRWILVGIFTTFLLFFMITFVWGMLIYKKTPLNLYSNEGYTLATEQKINFSYRMNYFHQSFLRKMCHYPPQTTFTTAINMPCANEAWGIIGCYSAQMKDITEEERKGEIDVHFLMNVLII